MTKLLSLLFLGCLTVAVMTNRLDLNLLADDTLAHCGKCGEGDKEEDQEHEGDEDTFAHCGKCGEGDKEEDQEHEGDEDTFV